MDYWFTSDQHFDHANILIYEAEARPFLEEAKGNILEGLKIMHKVLIEEHNKLVKPGDVVYHLGDFTMRGPEYTNKIRKDFVRKLNGEKELVLGSHDELKPFSYVNIGFRGVHTYLYLEKFDLYLIHDPAAAITRKDKLWLHGHVHSLYKTILKKDGTPGNTLNVCVDVWDLRPVHIDEIQTVRKELGV